MKTLLTTDGLAPHARFRHWRETICDQVAPVEFSQLDSDPFAGTLEEALVGPLQIQRIASTGVRSEVTYRSLHRFGNRGVVPVCVAVAGTRHLAQDDRTTTQRPGDIVILNHMPSVSQTETDRGRGGEALVLAIPIERLEHALGSLRLYANIAIPAGQGGATLARTFLHELLSVHETLDATTATRMAAIGVDLLIASVAQHMAQETPAPLQGTVLVQRAKAHIESHLGEHALDPSAVAAAMGISVRHLQRLFHERGRDVADWIWERRLVVAADHLRDPGRLHMQIGSIAFGCGFVSQAHFSRRFRDRFGVSPRHYRQTMLGAAA